MKEKKSVFGFWTRRQFLTNSIRLLILCGLGKGFYNTSRSQIEFNRIVIPLKGLPSSFEGVKIAHLTDFHSSFIVSKGFLAKAAQRTMEWKPDLVVLTGDFLSGSTKFLHTSVGEFQNKYLDRCIEALEPLKAPLGIYGVLGNHDFWSGTEAVNAICSQFTDKLGVRWLRNSSVTLERKGEAIDLLGVDDYWEESSSLRKSVVGLGGERVRILLSHNPDINEEIELLEERIDLVLSGHTHGGQVVLPLLGAPLVPSRFGQKYLAGLVKDGNRQTYINRGLGHLLVPFRLNCPPEVALITLKNAG